MKPSGIVAFLIALAAPFAAQQIPVPTIRVDVDLALINVTITDPEGPYVVGLQKENFQI